MKLKFVYFVIWTGPILSACGSHHSGDAVDETVVKAGTNKIVTALHYYKGGFNAPAGQLNWSDDMTIDFTKTGFPIAAKTADPLCFKSGMLRRVTVMSCSS